MSMDEEIDQLLLTLADIHGEDLNAFIMKRVCEATCAHRWDDVIKWNRVKWRARLRRGGAGSPRGAGRNQASAVP